MDAPPEGTQILDARPITAFAAGHLHGALSVPVSGTRFATKAAFVLGPGTAVVVATDEREAADAIRGLRSVGVLDIAGYVLGGGPERLELVSVDELDALLEQGAELIDVREKDERDSGYIAGSRNIPYRLLALGEADLPRDKTIVTICETGPRAAIAASILARTASTRTRSSTAASTRGSPRASPPSSSDAAAAEAYFGGPTRSTVWPAARIDASSSWQCASSRVETTSSISVWSALVVRPSR